MKLNDLFSRFGFLKPILLFVVAMLIGLSIWKGLAALENVSQDYAKRGEQIETLTTSVANVQADKTALENALLSERILRANLQEKIKANSELLSEHSEAITKQKADSEKKIETIETVAMESTDETCINTDMPDSIISMFKYPADT